MPKSLLLIFLLVSCASRPIIPPEPKFKPIIIYSFESGVVCMDADGAVALKDNVKALHDYKNVLLKLLKGGRDNGGL